MKIKNRGGGIVTQSAHTFENEKKAIHNFLIGETDFLMGGKILALSQSIKKIIEFGVRETSSQF